MGFDFGAVLIFGSAVLLFGMALVFAELATRQRGSDSQLLHAIQQNVV